MNNNRIKEVRLAEHKTQKDLAKLLGVSEQAIAYYEKALREPPLKSWVKLANYLNVSVSYLQGINKYKNNQEILQRLEKYRTDDGKLPLNKKTSGLIREIQNSSGETAVKNFKKLNTVFNSIDSDIVLKEDDRNNSFDELLDKVGNTREIEKIVDELTFIYSIYVNSILGHSGAQSDKKIIQNALRKILNYDEYATSKMYTWRYF